MRGKDYKPRFKAKMSEQPRGDSGGATSTATATTQSATGNCEAAAQNGHLSPTNGLSNGVMAAATPPEQNGTASPSNIVPQQQQQQQPTNQGGTHGNHHGNHTTTTTTTTTATTRVSSPNNLHRPSPNHRGHSPNRYSPNPNSRGNSPQSQNSPISGQHHQHVVHVHVNPGETFSVRVGDQIQHIQGRFLHFL